MDRIDIIDKLNKAAEKATSMAINRSDPIRMSKRSAMVGNTLVEKNSNGFYDIILPSKDKLYEDISAFDVAIIIAQRYNSGETSIIKKILLLENRYTKYHNDMLNYLSCLKGAKKKHDIERMAILEDKFQVAETLAKNARDNIAVFKRIK